MPAWPAPTLARPTWRRPIQWNIPTSATFARMALITGFATVVVILFIVMLFTHAARDLQSSPTYHRICRVLGRVP